MPVLKYRPNVGSPWQVVGITGQTQVVGMFPQIIVTAPTGSTVTCRKGNVVLNAEEVDGTWTFTVMEYGEWTIEYLNGLLKYTENVLVDAVAQYKVEIGFKIWLFKDGD